MATASVTNTFVTGTTILAAAMNQNFTDLVGFLNGSVVHVDGSKAMTGALAMGSNKITGLAKGAAAGEAADFVQADTMLIPIQVTGPQEVGTDRIGRFYLPYAGTFVEVFMWIDDAPTGADLQFDINLNGTSLWNVTQANRPIIPAAGTTETVTTFDTTTFADGDYLTVDCDQVGSTNAGGKVIGWIRIRRTA